MNAPQHDLKPDPWWVRWRANFHHAIARMRFLITQFSLGRWDELSRTELLLAYPSILIVQVFRELIRDRGLVRASSLAYTTTLSVVPLLTVATTLSTAFGVGDQALTDLLANIMPVSADTIIAQLQEFSARQGGTLSGIGSVILILLGVALFNNIEHAFNDIWRIRTSRPLLNKFLTFYALITLAPLLITISVIESARVQIIMDDIPFVASVGYKLLPIGLAVIAFTSANKLLPHTEVKWVPALVSGIVTAIAFELAKAGFNIYVNVFLIESYTNVYGAISLIPIFLVWVYVSWVIVLFGAELTYTIQNLKHLLLPQRLHDINQNSERRFDPLISLELYAPIAAHFKQGQGPIPLDRVAAISRVPTDLARELLKRMLANELLMEVTYDDPEGASVGYVPSRPLEDIPLLDVLDSCRSEVKVEEQGRFMRALFSLHHSREEEIFGELTCASLVNEGDTQRLALLADAITSSVHAATDRPDPEDPNVTLENRLSRAGQLLRESMSGVKARPAIAAEAKDPEPSESNPIDQLLGGELAENT